MLSGPWKGVLLGACNTIVFAAVIATAGALDGTQLRDFQDTFTAIGFTAILPAMMVGAGLGSLGDSLARWRRTVLLSLGLAAAATVGVLVRGALAPYAWVPTACTVLLLECWTRSAATSRPQAPLTVLERGAALGFATVVTAAVLAGVAVATGRVAPHDLRFRSHEEPLGCVAIVLIAGLIPGLIAGTALGHVAERCRDRPPLVRFALLAVIALAVVAGLGLATGRTPFIRLAATPTLLATMVLERWTRGAALTYAAISARTRSASHV